MFHYDRGLFLTGAELAVDLRRRQKCGFISHAHADHMARHELALCTPETSRLYQFRLGKRPTLEMPYRKRIARGNLRLTTYPAGHCLGSAMLFAESDRQSLLYTGDFKLGESATAERIEIPPADILVMESTFGRPAYRLPPRKETVERLLDVVQRTLAAGKTPVLHAYVLGKSQEVTRILTAAGIPVFQHPDVYAVSQIYRQCGVDLGEVKRYPGMIEPGWAVVVPPKRARHYRLAKLGEVVSIGLTGWAVHSGAEKRLGVDVALPLSDHADFDELLEMAARVDPQKVYCTHGHEDFALHLRSAGFDAELLQ